MYCVAYYDARAYWQGVGMVSLKDSFLIYNWVVGMLIQTSMLFPIILQESTADQLLNADLVGVLATDICY